MSAIKGDLYLLIDKINENTNLHLIPKLFQYLLDDKNHDKEMIISTICKRVEKLSMNQMIKLDKLFRKDIYYEYIYYNYEWNDIDPNVLSCSGISESHKGIIYGLASFHHNGYFRAKVISKLSKINESKVLAFLLIRCNDWVISISNIAEKIVKERINNYNINFIIDNLPMFYHLSNLSRYNNLHLLKAAEGIIINNSNEFIIQYGLKSEDTLVRRYTIEIILKNSLMEFLEILKFIVNDPEIYLRNKIFSKIIDRVTLDEFNLIEKLIKNNKSYKIREYYLDLTYKFYKEKSISIFMSYIFDANKTVRETARFYLSKIKEVDYPKFYIQSIENNELLITSIKGLGETGSKQDCSQLIKFLNFDKSKIVRATIKALIKLEYNQIELIKFLEDKRIGVSNDIRKILKGVYINEKELYSIYKTSEYFHSKMNAVILLCNLSKWTEINYIIEFITSDIGEFSFYADEQLKKWIFRYNKSFVNPSFDEIERLKSTLNNYSSKIKKEYIEWIEFTLESF